MSQWSSTSAPFISGAALTLAVERRITHEHTEEKKTFLWLSDLMTSFAFLFIFEGTSLFQLLLANKQDRQQTYKLAL